MRDADRVGVGARVAADALHRVGDLLALGHVAQLRHVPDLVTATIQPGRRRAKHLDATAQRLQQAEHQLEQGAFTGAVRPEQRYDLTLKEGGADPEQDDAVIVASHDLVEQQGRLLG